MSSKAATESTDDSARAYIRYVSGFIKPASMQEAGVRGDPQLQTLKGYLQAFLGNQSSPLAILDFGCGKGPLLQALLELRAFIDGGHQYIGVDLEFPQLAHELAVSLHAYSREPRPEFLKRGVLFSKPHSSFKIPIKLIVLRNVLHEIPPSEWASTFFQLTRLLVTGGTILIQDMVRLPEGELEAITWDIDDLSMFFPSKYFVVNDNRDISRTGVPWFTAEIRQVSSPEEKLSDWERRRSHLVSAKIAKIDAAVEYITRDRSILQTGLEYLHLVHMKVALERSLHSLGKLIEDGDELRGIAIGNAVFPIIVLEGDGTTVFRKNEVDCSSTTTAYTLPEPLRLAAPALLEAAKQDAKQRGAILFNGPHYGLQNYRIDIRDVLTEARSLVLHLKPTTYFDHIVSNYTFAQKPVSPFFPDPTKVRVGEFASSPLANQLGININVITRRDNRLIYASRSPRAFTYSSGYVCGINASMSRGVEKHRTDEDGLGNPDPFRTIVREANEELGVRVNNGDILILGLLQDLKSLQPFLMGHCYLDESARTIIDKAAILARDRFEYHGLLSMPFEPRSIAQHMTLRHREWVPQCAISLIFSLINVYGFDAVDEAFGRTDTGLFTSTGSSLYVPAVRRNIREFVQAKLEQLRVQGQVLDVGSGYRSHISDIAIAGVILRTLDVNPNVGADIIADAALMKGIESASIDCVICTELLEHVFEPAKVLDEIHRILKPSGILILSVPFAVSIHERDNMPDLWRFTPKGLMSLLTKRFTDIEINSAGDQISPINVLAVAHKP